MEVVKTVRVPVHYALTKRKLSMLDRLMARHTYAVRVFSKLIEQSHMNVDAKYGKFRRQDIESIKRLTKLNIAYVQQCRDQALWMWRSYHAQRQEWERDLKYARGRWREKLLKREPKKPFSKGSRGKVPIRIDVRTGVVQASKRMKLTPYLIHLSTLEKHHRITVPLNPAKYHIELLRNGGIVDFQLVKRNRWHYAHICARYEVPDVPVRAVRGVDLGVRRAVATVLLKPNQPICRGDLSILKDGKKKHRLDMLNRRVRKLQRAREWQPLKRLRHKRIRVAEYYDRLHALRVAQLAEVEGSIVAVGYPKRIRYKNYRGNGRRGLRRLLQQRFPYGRRIRYIIENCTKRGVRAEPVFEYSTSQRCHRCGSMSTRRMDQSLFWCLDCGLQYNADWNAAINIGSVLLPTALSRRATEGLAQAGDELGYHQVSPEAENETLTPQCQPL